MLRGYLFGSDHLLCCKTLTGSEKTLPAHSSCCASTCRWVWGRQPCKSPASCFHYAGQITAGATGLYVPNWLLPRGLCPATLQPPGEDSLEANCSVRGQVQLFATPWTVALRAPLSKGFSSQEYWSGLPFPPPGDHPHPRIEPLSSALTGRIFFTTAPIGKPEVS